MLECQQTEDDGKSDEQCRARPPPMADLIVREYATGTREKGVRDGKNQMCIHP